MLRLQYLSLWISRLYGRPVEKALPTGEFSTGNQPFQYASCSIAVLVSGLFHEYNKNHKERFFLVIF
jgi:hypothetical protein